MPTIRHQDAFHIAFCVDNHYFRAMGAMIASIIAHNPRRRFVFHVFAFHVSEDNARRMKEIELNPDIQVVPHVVDPSLFQGFADMIASSYYSLSTFTRLIVPSVLKDVTDRVFYLDADMLCIGSLDELAAMDLEDTVALVVEDVGWSTPEGRDGRYSVLGMKARHYFNAGILYINIHEWEKHRISETAIELLLSNREKLTFNDQDALNIVLEGRVRYIPIKWNYIYSMIADLKRGKLSMDAVGDAVILHFAGLIKPWNDWSGHVARELYLRYHALSAWRDTPLDTAPLNHKEMRIHSRSLMKRGRIALGLYWYLRFAQAALARKLKR
ncbi:glycosyltransferase [Herbaspirillum sp. WKF16]|uniref:glycosyltransferase family 8 protein n=1 Tax=Herbaspirillum sp. WKF16 TaxID=3028312 RepID=UPI0023A9A102|nr:glycosyltransferase [Herbaspirillum sp. WKF16]WDZ95089.1 glycosyltransferase [Herbaspirillum sp. WKF16]